MSDETVSLELRSILQRFNDSSDVLEQLRERLRRLATADEMQSASARSIGDVSDKLGQFIGELQNETAALASAAASTKAAMETARELLQGAELTAIREEIGRLQTGQDILSTESARVVELFERELTSVRADLGEANHARQQLEAKIAAVPEKTRRKLGL